MTNKYEMEMGGRVLEFEFGKVANLANGSVTIKVGDVVLLVTDPFAKLATFPTQTQIQEPFHPSPSRIYLSFIFFLIFSNQEFLLPLGI
jgi:hypothetical protein